MIKNLINDEQDTEVAFEANNAAIICGAVKSRPARKNQKNKGIMFLLFESSNSLVICSLFFGQSL